jgi:hypothetical protein
MGMIVCRLVVTRGDHITEESDENARPIRPGRRCWMDWSPMAFLSIIVAAIVEEIGGVAIKSVVAARVRFGSTADIQRISP